MVRFCNWCFHPCSLYYESRWFCILRLYWLWLMIQIAVNSVHLVNEGYYVVHLTVNQTLANATLASLPIDQEIDTMNGTDDDSDYWHGGDEFWHEWNRTEYSIAFMDLVVLTFIIGSLMFLCLDKFIYPSMALVYVYFNGIVVIAATALRLSYSHRWQPLTQYLTSMAVIVWQILFNTILTPLYAITIRYAFSTYENLSDYETLSCYYDINVMGIRRNHSFPHRFRDQRQSPVDDSEAVEIEALMEEPEVEIAEGVQSTPPNGDEEDSSDDQRRNINGQLKRMKTKKL